ncbi:MAG: hypothetical protein GC168_00720 [Candidatus Hydrogenedens sp.]|nr:hypothetical protein [Candidatus Hydrogenedens sp.]
MKLKRNQIIFAVVLLSVLGAFGGVYQFYFKEKLDTYAKEKRFRIALDAAARELADAFHGYRPEQLIALWRAEVQPWADALRDRSTFFNFGDWYEHPVPPEEGRILKVWYGEELNKMLLDLEQTMREKGPYVNAPLLDDLRAKFDVSTVEELDQQRVINRDIVIDQLAKMNFGSQLVEMLLDAKVAGINDVSVWPRRKDKAHKDQLVLQTFGVDCYFQMRELALFFERLRMDNNRYWNVDAIKFYNQNLVTPQEPYVLVKMIITQANFVGAVDVEGGGGNAQQLFNMNNMPAPRQSRRSDVVPEEKSALMEWWTWFRRNVLYLP